MITRLMLGVLIVVLTLVPAISVQAQESNSVAVLDFKQSDLDNDGRPDLVTIKCACVTDLDKVLVLDGGDDMQWTQDWQSGISITNDTWLFDIHDDGTANLIIVFKQDGYRHTAEFYDDSTGDGKVSYQVNGKQVLINESPYWTLQVTAEGDWIDRDGNLNLNLQVLMDKPLVTSLSNQVIAEKYMPHDGKPDWSIKVTDSNYDGRIEYVVMKMLALFPIEWGIGRFLLYVNANLEQSIMPKSALFWPFLDFKPPSEIESRYFERIPNLFIDWNTSQINTFTLPGYPFEHGYYIQSLQNVFDGKVNNVDFEMPQAYYDIAANHDGNPDLSIRLFTDFISSMDQTRWKEIRYSWNQFHTGSLIWDYKIGMLGDPDISSVVYFPDFGLRMIPYEKLPYWATKKEWELTTFVANEGGNRESSEGIYAWTPWAGSDPVSKTNPSAEAHNAALEYVSGAKVRPPEEYFTEIWSGYRGEYNFSDPQIPLLYLSPVDRRLHLLGAEYGIWNVDGNAKIYLADLNNDSYLDQWTYSEVITNTQPFTQTRTLIVADPFLIYHGNDSVVIRNASVPQSLFEVTPPRNHHEWAALGNKLTEQQRDFAPADFEAMIMQFPGPESRISNTQLKDYRPTTEGGFRFVLDLLNDYSLSGDDLMNLSGLAPGQYVVNYSRGEFHVRALTPPALTVSLRAPENIYAGETQHLKIHVDNAGLQDARKLTLVAFAKQKNVVEEIGNQSIDAISGKPARLLLNWQPAAIGTWQVMIRLQDAEGEVVSELLQALEVSRPQEKLIKEIPATAGRSRSMFPWLTLLGLVASSACCAAIASWFSNNAKMNR